MSFVDSLNLKKLLVTLCTIVKNQKTKTKKGVLNGKYK